MTTLIDVVIPTEIYIEAIFNEHVGDSKSEDEYVTDTIRSMVAILNKSPQQYISYGPWWPAIKTIMINHGYDDFGQITNSDVAEVMSYPRDALTLVAGILYSNERLESHMVFDQYHYLPVQPQADDTEPYLYVSEDESFDKYHL